MVSGTGEGYLFFPFRLWSPRAVAETHIEGIVCPGLLSENKIVPGGTEKERSLTGG